MPIQKERRQSPPTQRSTGSRTPTPHNLTQHNLRQSYTDWAHIKLIVYRHTPTQRSGVECASIHQNQISRAPTQRNTGSRTSTQRNTSSLTPTPYKLSQSHAVWVRIKLVVTRHTPTQRSGIECASIHQNQISRTPTQRNAVSRTLTQRNAVSRTPTQRNTGGRAPTPQKLM